MLKTAGGQGYSHVIYSDDNGATWNIGGEVKGGNECAVAELPDGNNQFWARFQSGNSLRFQAEKTTAPKYTANKTEKGERFGDDNWHHIAMVFDQHEDEGTARSRILLYVDGAASGSAKTLNGLLDTPSKPYFIGCNLRLTNGAWAPENMYSGMMDDYLFYDVALTDTQIKTLSGL